ncbi:GcrA family cell cycle regulator [Caulobacter soli]|uniref:GcrA family cell cycle regulator n=1 Tax=Caulobacter soli TaxID=2708539 RepID=UPI0013EE2CBE|nr:GcrA family cell cycle regulator [Caulobacter soli]
MSSSSWSAERIVALRRLWLEGASASEIARALGGVTRNAVIGKIHRLGLTGRMAPSAPRRTGRSGGERRPVRRISSSKPPPPPATPGVRAAPRTRRVVEAVARVFDTCALSARICRWPLGDPREAGFGYCGDGVAGQGPYCAPHRRVARPPRLQVGQDRDRRGGRRLAGPRAAGTIAS